MTCIVVSVVLSLILASMLAAADGSCMAIKADKWIRRMAREHGMIEPFVDEQVRAGVVSYGLSSYGYDIRVADEFKIFTNINNTVIDPKNFDPRSFVDIKADVCIVPPNSFALARTIEYFRIPRDVLTICLGKSTYARCGIIVNVTPFEPEWEGFVTLEISNTTPLPGEDLRERRHRAGAVLPERRAVRAVVRRQEGQVPQAARRDAAEGVIDLTDQSEHDKMSSPDGSEGDASRSVLSVAGWSSPVARWAHNPKVAGSNPAPATKFPQQISEFTVDLRSPPTCLHGFVCYSAGSSSRIAASNAAGLRCMYRSVIERS